MVAAGLRVGIDLEMELRIKVWPVLFTVPMRISGPLAGYSARSSQDIIYPGALPS